VQRKVEFASVLEKEKDASVAVVGLAGCVTIVVSGGVVSVGVLPVVPVLSVLPEVVVEDEVFASP
jgi:hypothetical protein